MLSAAISAMLSPYSKPSSWASGTLPSSRGFTLGFKRVLRVSACYILPDRSWTLADLLVINRPRTQTDYVTDYNYT